MLMLLEIEYLFWYPINPGTVRASLIITAINISSQPAHASNVVNETVANGAETVLEASALSAPIFESTKN